MCLIECSPWVCYYTSEMSCPYFDPVEFRCGNRGSNHAMLPLGDSWSGVCRAIPEQPGRPDDTALQSYCNLGYARGKCDHFPSGHGPDAARFTITEDAGATLRLYYVLERDHEPFAHGPIAFCAASGQFTPPPEGELTARQARAYVESYMRRKAEVA